MAVVSVSSTLLASAQCRGRADVQSWCIAYLGGLVVCLPRQLRAEREAREKASRIDKAMIRLKDRSGSDSHSSISSFSIGKQHAALWPNQYGEGKEVLSPGGTTVLALAPTLSAETWKRGSDDGDSRFGRTPITTVGLGVSRSGTLASQRSGVSAAWNGQVGAAYTADSPRQMSSHVAQQVDGGYDRQPPHIVGDTTPTTGKRWSGETTSPVREVVLEDKDVPSRALNAWGSGHARKRSGANW